jgi:hypothetical protein
VLEARKKPRSEGRGRVFPEFAHRCHDSFRQPAHRPGSFGYASLKIILCQASTRNSRAFRFRVVRRRCANFARLAPYPKIHVRGRTESRLDSYRGIFGVSPGSCRDECFPQNFNEPAKMRRKPRAGLALVCVSCSGQIRVPSFQTHAEFLVGTDRPSHGSRIPRAISCRCWKRLRGYSLA